MEKCCLTCINFAGDKTEPLGICIDTDNQVKTSGYCDDWEMRQCSNCGRFTGGEWEGACCEALTNPVCDDWEMMEDA